MKLRTLYPDKNPKWVIIILAAIVVVLFSLMFFGCATPEKLIKKALDKDSAAVAKVTRDLFPCTDILKPDTAILYRDTTVYIECPDSIPPAMFETIRFETVTNTRIVRVPVKLPIETRYVNRYFEDSAKIFLYRKQVERLQADTASLNKQVAKYKSKLHTRNVQALWLLGLVIALLVWTFRKVILKLFI